jgi:hypothetical protein
MNQDRFVFTPSDWGMDRYTASNLNLEMRVILTAMMTLCGSSARRLAGESLPEVTYMDATKKLNKDVLPAVREQDVWSCG